MSARNTQKYPVGDQSFESVRLGGFVYVDKSRYIERLLDGKYYFLGRPRRFGKSLFLSMLRSFFEGRRELFRGLYAEGMDWDWEPHPVFHLDLNTQQYRDESDLDVLISDFLGREESKYGVRPSATANLSSRFSNLIRGVSEATGKGVVVLVDEYDKPLVNNINDRERFEYYRDRLGALYSNFKSSADYLRMVFLTGVSRFGKLSFFSGLNNIQDISFSDKYSAICGITEEELVDNFGPGIGRLSEKYGMTRERQLETLKRMYDGYHFSAESPDIYNPFSLLNAFANESLGSYWISSGTPTLLIEQLKRTDTDLGKLLTQTCAAEDLEGLDIDNIRPVSLFYQTGYLTIKDYDRSVDLFSLGLPNEEVKRGFFEYILPFYGNLGNQSTRAFVVELRREMETGDVEGFMERLQSFFSGISYEMRLEEERNVQNAMLVLFRLIGMQTEVEYRTSRGSIDILVRTDRYVYVMELKFNGTA